MIERHLHGLDDELDLAQQLKRRLETIARSLRSMETPSTEDLLRSLELMSEFEKYYTPEQLKQLAERKELVGEERIRQVTQEWQDLFAEFRAAMARGDDPSAGARVGMEPKLGEYMSRARTALDASPGS